MKKAISVLLTLVLVLGAAVASAELLWSDVEEAAGSVPGGFYPFSEPGVEIWIPDVLIPVNLTDDDRAQGYIAYFTAADQSAAVAVQYFNTGFTTPDEYARWVSGRENVSGVKLLLANGLDIVTYDLKEADVSCLSWARGDGFLLEISFYPMSDENFAGIAGVIRHSFRAMQPAD